MEEMIYTITLADGTELANLHMNGNNFVSQTEVTEDMFDENLSEITINDGHEDHVMENMELIQVAHYTDGWYFILREIPADVLERRQIQSDIDYIAMMADIDL